MRVSVGSYLHKNLSRVQKHTNPVQKPGCASDSDILGNCGRSARYALFSGCQSWVIAWLRSLRQCFNARTSKDCVMGHKTPSRMGRLSPASSLLYIHTRLFQWWCEIQLTLEASICRETHDAVTVHGSIPLGIPRRSFRFRLNGASGVWCNDIDTDKAVFNLRDRTWARVVSAYSLMPCWTCCIACPCTWLHTLKHPARLTISGTLRPWYQAWCGTLFFFFSFEKPTLNTGSRVRLTIQKYQLDTHQTTTPRWATWV